MVLDVHDGQLLVLHPPFHYCFKSFLTAANDRASREYIGKEIFAQLIMNKKGPFAMLYTLARGVVPLQLYDLLT